jgi:hypothetical protein
MCDDKRRYRLSVASVRSGGGRRGRRPGHRCRRRRAPLSSRHRASSKRCLQTVARRSGPSTVRTASECGKSNNQADDSSRAETKVRRAESGEFAVSENRLGVSDFSRDRFHDGEAVHPARRGRRLGRVDEGRNREGVRRRHVWDDWLARVPVPSADGAGSCLMNTSRHSAPAT